jgi:hypothetical protein
VETANVVIVLAVTIAVIVTVTMVMIIFAKVTLMSQRQKSN